MLPTKNYQNRQMLRVHEVVQKIKVAHIFWRCGVVIALLI